VDASGNLFIADYTNHRVRKVDVTGTITTVAGGTQGFCGDGGPAISACLNYPAGVAVDAAGNLYIAERSNHRVRKVDASGTISTFAGSSAGFCGDGGPATSACLLDPIGVTVDTAGQLIIAEYSGGRIRKVDATGTITSVPGSWLPFGVAADAAGNLFVSDYGGSHRVRKVDVTGATTTVAGGGAAGSFCGDGGPATLACLSNPAGVAVDAAGNLLIADSYNHRVRKVDATGTITTLAGNGSGTSCGDGGPAPSACVAQPLGVALDAAGNLFIAEYSGSRVRKVSAPPTGPQLTGLTLKKPTVAGCKPVVGTVTLSAPAPAGGLVVSLGETFASASVPASLAIPAGATSRTFKVTTAAVGVPEAGTVSATLGATTLTAPLTVRPISVLSVTLTPNPVVGGSPVGGVVKLECKAQPAAILVTLGSTNAGVAGPTVPNVLVAQGTQTAPFSVATTPVGATTKPKITATANGLTKAKPLTVTP
jgi:hypothetical protein